MSVLEKYLDQMETCSHCQFCQAACPVFKEDMLESHGARARVGLIRACLIDGELDPSRRFKEILAKCLLCGSCAHTCPSAVPVDDIVVAARHELYKGKRQNALKRGVLRRFMKQRGLGGVMALGASVGKKIGLAPSELPISAKAPFSKKGMETAPVEGEVRARVAYYIGCATNSFYPDTARDVIRVFSANGIEVVVPDGLVCCGMPALAEGDLDTALEMARINVEALAGLKVDAVITDCTSCGLMLKLKMANLFGEGDPPREKAEVLAGNVWEATDYLGHVGLASEPDLAPARFTYHVPCHRNWSDTLIDAPRRLFSNLILADLVEMDSPEACCGAGGAFFADNRQLAESIRARKIDDIKQTGAKTVLTQCPACRTWLAAALKNHKVIHPIGLLAKAYSRPVTPGTDK